MKYSAFLATLLNLCASSKLATVPYNEANSWQDLSAAAHAVPAGNHVSQVSPLCRIFAWHQHDPKLAMELASEGDPPLFVKKDIESWEHNTAGRCEKPTFVNKSNIRDYIPDLPRGWDRIADERAMSDFVRYALLYHHGGIYFDTDILVMKDMAPILDRLQDHDFISYCTTGQNCDQGSFSSNFMAGRKGSVVFKEIWEAQKAALAKRCDHDPNVEVCCWDDEKRDCHVNWGGIGEKTSHPAFKKLIDANTPHKKYCFTGDQTFVPDNFWDPIHKHPKLNEAQMELSKLGVQQPFDRIMYHLFASGGFYKKFGSLVLDPSTAIGFMFCKSLGACNDVPRLSARNDVRNDGSALVVTAFWPIKSKVGSPQQSLESYSHDMATVMALPAHLVIWGDEKGLPVLSKSRNGGPLEGQYNMQVKDLSPCSKNWDLMSSHQSDYTHPVHVPSIELGCVWESKLDLLQKSKQKHPSFEWFIWLDAGFHGNQEYFKMYMNNGQKMWPNSEKLAHLEKGKLLFSKSENDCSWCTGWDYCHCVAGTALIVHTSVVEQLAEKFATYQQKCMDEALEKFVCLSDQVILTRVVQNYPGLFKEVAKGYGENVKPVTFYHAASTTSYDDGALLDLLS